MERALYVTKADLLRYYDGSFSRLYFGHEFCERLLPTAEDLDEILDFVARHDLRLSFLTPYVTDEGLRRLEPLVDKIADKNPGAEVIFSDWGVFPFLRNKYSGLRLVVGRLLNKMKRGPRLMNVIDVLPRSTQDYFRRCSFDVPVLRDFLVRNGIRRVELDNLLQGIDPGLLDRRISASLYMPYVYVTTSRLCLSIGGNEHEGEDRVGIFPCRKECQDYEVHLENIGMPVPLIRKGNTIFLRNETPIGGVDGGSGIDRIVWEPVVPV